MRHVWPNDWLGGVSGVWDGVCVVICVLWWCVAIQCDVVSGQCEEVKQELVLNDAVPLRSTVSLCWMRLVDVLTFFFQFFFT